MKLANVLAIVMATCCLAASASGVDFHAKYQLAPERSTKQVVARSPVFEGVPTDGDLVVVSRVMDGPAICTARSGDRLVYSTGAALHLMDVQQNLLHRLPLDATIRDVVIAGSTVYCTREEKVLVYDISNDDFSLIGELEILAPNRMVLEGSTLFVTDAVNGLYAVDVSNPAAPSIIGTLAGAWSELAVDGSYAYVSPHKGHMPIIDISNPAAMTVVGTYYTEDPEMYMRDVAAHDGVAYIGSWDTFLTVDVSDPANPVLIRDHGGRGDEKLDLSYPHLYTTYGWSDTNLLIFDVTDPYYPQELSRTSVPGRVQRVSVEGSTLDLAHYTVGFLTFDVSSPSAPAETHSFDIDGEAVETAVYQNMLYAVTYYGGVYPIEIADLARPKRLSPVLRGETNWCIASQGSDLFIGGYLLGSSIWNISVPEIPEMVGSLSVGYEPFKIMPNGNIIYSADGTQGIEVADYSVPASPAWVDSIGLGEGAVAFGGSFGDGHLYAADYYNGVFIFDASDPRRLQKIAQFEGGSDLWDALYHNNLLFLCDLTDGLAIYDVSDPSNPVYLSEVPSFSANDVEVVQNFAYVAGGLDGVIVLDIIDPSSPRVIQTVNTGGFCEDLTLRGNILFVSDRAGGVYIMRHDAVGVEGGAPASTLPSRTTIQSISPNPFNPETAVVFELVRSGAAQLNVYDLTGRRIRVLLDEQVPVGRHTVRWDGTDEQSREVSSGVYLIRLSTEGATETRRAVLVK